MILDLFLLNGAHRLEYMKRKWMLNKNWIKQNRGNDDVIDDLYSNRMFFQRELVLPIGVR